MVHRGKRLLGPAVLLLLLAVLLGPAPPASALPESPAETAVIPAAVSAVIPAASEAVPAPAKEAAEDIAEATTPFVPEVPESEPAEEGYFADAVFLGDSRTEGFHLYSGLEEGTYLFAVGATVESVFSKETQETESGKASLLDALAELDCGRVYIMLGVNELGWPQAEQFQDQYGKVIDRIWEDHPGVEVVIQSILPVSARQEAKGSYVNNGRIAVYNALLLELAEEKTCPYVNVAEAVTDEDGCLRPELTGDGVHLNGKGCRVWLEYLKTHTV